MALFGRLLIESHQIRVSRMNHEEVIRRRKLNNVYAVLRQAQPHYRILISLNGNIHFTRQVFSGPAVNQHHRRRRCRRWRRRSGSFVRSRTATCGASFGRRLLRTYARTTGQEHKQKAKGHVFSKHTNSSYRYCGSFNAVTGVILLPDWPSPVSVVDGAALSGSSCVSSIEIKNPDLRFRSARPVGSATSFTLKRSCLVSFCVAPLTTLVISCLPITLTVYGSLLSTVVSMGVQRDCQLSARC